MKHAHFSVEYPEQHPLHRQLLGEGPISRAELLLWSPTGEATTLCWCDGDRTATERVVSGIESLQSATYVEENTGTYAFLAQNDFEFSARILDLIADSAVVFRPPVVFLETGRVRFQAIGEANALAEFHDDLRSIADVWIERVQPFERPHTGGGLTDRQATALEAAVRVGYYEIPREGSISDIADRLDCAESTAGELVRKAEAAVIRGWTGPE
jgi:predicted DNA binding protein